ncbi:MAG: DUF1997 domain-containing protein [Anaerolineae bacterium]
MIDIAVSVRRTFVFPAALPATMAYLADFRQVLSYLPHLRLVKVHAANQYRILYQATQAGVYRISFYCDLQVHLDAANRILSVTPLAGIPPVSSRVTLNSLAGQGYYSSQSAFEPAGDHTRVDYVVEIKARIPKRLQLRLVPDRVFKDLAQELVRQRLEEMTEEFIAHLTDRYRQSQ